MRPLRHGRIRWMQGVRNGQGSGNPIGLGHCGERPWTIPLAGRAMDAASVAHPWGNPLGGRRCGSRNRMSTDCSRIGRRRSPSVETDQAPCRMRRSSKASSITGSNVVRQRIRPASPPCLATAPSRAKIKYLVSDGGARHGAGFAPWPRPGSGFAAWR